MSSDFARGFVASEFSRHELDLMLKLQTMREGGQDTRKEKMLLDLQQRRVAAQNRIRTMEQTRDVRIKKWLEQRQLEVEARRRRNERRHADAAERVAVRAGERAFKHLAESEAKQREKTEEELAAQLERVRQSVRNQADTMRRKAAARSRECDDRKWGWHCAGSPRATTPCSSALEGIAGASPGVLGTTGVRYDSEPSATQPASALAHPHPPAAGQSRPRSARGGASASTPEKAGGAAGGSTPATAPATVGDTGRAYDRRAAKPPPSYGAYVDQFGRGQQTLKERLDLHRRDAAWAAEERAHQEKLAAAKIAAFEARLARPSLLTPNRRVKQEDRPGKQEEAQQRPSGAPPLPSALRPTSAGGGAVFDQSVTARAQPVSARRAAAPPGRADAFDQRRAQMSLRSGM